MNAPLRFRPVIEDETIEPVSPGIPFHPLANLFPMMGKAEFAELVEDVRRHGIEEEIVLLDGMILDGRNRYCAAVDAGVFPADVDPKTRWEFVFFGEGGLDGVLEGRSPLEWVMTKNLHRRHLDESQRAMVAARIANMRQGERTDLKVEPKSGKAEPSANLPKVSQARAAELANVSTRSVTAAAKVLKAAPEVAAAVDRGKLKVSAAAEIATAPKEEQPALVEGALKRRQAHVWERADLEWYVEPVACTKALLGVESFWGQILDPSCGGGNIPKAVLADPRGIPVFGSDIVRRVPEGTDWFLGEHDFLKDDFDKLGIDPRRGPLNIVNNPPYFGAQGTEDFVRKALSLATGKVAIFTELRFLGSKARAEGLFREHPPTRIHIVLPRPSCPPGTYIEAGNKPQGGTADWCWIVWDREAIGVPTQFCWLVMEGGDV